VCLFATRIVDQNPSHCFGCSGEEMGSARPRLIWPHQPQIGLVNQRSCLKRLTGILTNQSGHRQLPQLIVDKRQELLGGRRITVLNGVQDLRNVWHQLLAPLVCG
jgi:hypothetical protein